MANELDETNPVVNEAGRDVNVIAKQIPVQVGVGSTVFQVILWVLFIIPGIIFTVMKVKAGSYLRSLEQKIQHDASQVDNYLEQRVMILQNLAQLVNKAVELDKDTFTAIAEARSGKISNDNDRNEMGTTVENLNARLNLQIEAYPELKSHNEIKDAIQQNSYLQKEITAAREQYNDTVQTWNTAIQQWPTKMIVAAKAGYTTRIPFSTSKTIKDAARGTFF